MQRRVITLGPIFKKMVLNQAQGLKKKSHEVSVRKDNNQLRYNKKCWGGWILPPALLELRYQKDIFVCVSDLMRMASLSDFFLGHTVQTCLVSACDMDLWIITLSSKQYVPKWFWNLNKKPV